MNPFFDLYAILREWRATAGSARERELDSLECVWKVRVV